MNQKSFANIILIILGVIILAGISGYFVLTRKPTPAIQQTPIPTPTQPPVTQPSTSSSTDETAKLTMDVLENTRYYSLFFEKIIKLTKGLYSEPPKPGTVSHCEVRIYENKITFGDLNNDGKDDAAVILSGNCGGSGSLRELAIITNQNGKPYYLTSKNLGDRVIINSATIEAGVTTLDMTIQGPNDGMCCPTLHKIFKYKLSGNKVIEVE